MSVFRHSANRPRGKLFTRAMLFMPILLVATGNVAICKPLTEPIEEFVAGVRAARREFLLDRISRDDYAAAVQALRTTATEQLRSKLPEAIEELGKWLEQTTESEKDLDRWLESDDPDDRQSRRMDELLSSHSSEDYVPRCAVAYLIGMLGRDAPEHASRILLAAVPLPERSEDECVLGALVFLGPPAYGTIAAVVERGRNVGRMWVGMTALLAQARETEFPHLAGLGAVEEWDNTYPTSKRGLRRLAQSWTKWWDENGSRFDWDPEDQVLRARGVVGGAQDHRN